ncbi:MAG: transcriptional regulator NrdR [Candidatus Magasanikbacteria bacterium CG_4_9_14_3_um_filter_32_9]|uniref:Transcriptional repressor NrdR n=1 Tax=Candidatus Magasanikbacteria bacterium CG_4_9_14_3_um_filter_32_9 TaxID=1974644 RepID=A0A2M7Z7B7_9BACT|nr:MAG: transcriptional regulator NrdR [Candidatus Magasanikbacteria bacterium CG_4_9_14_3_um_filter_32_9]
MYCPVCSSKETRVVDSRIIQDGMAVKRRRECEKCSYRFSTKEEMELLDLVVIKGDGKRESYSRNKMEKGLLISLSKRPYTQEKLDRMVNSIERAIQKRRKREILSKEIGEIVMKHLKKFDKVAYVRFASVYRSFEDVEGFQNAVNALSPRKKK